MRIAVVGAGGVGGYYGALLSASGNAVHFIARGPHLEAMRERGLRVRSALGDLLIRPVIATDRPAEVGPVELALFCTKAFDTEAAARQCTELVGAGTIVVGLQNGVDAADQLGRIFGLQHIVAGTTWLSSAIESPGVIHHISESRRVVLGELDGRESGRLRKVHRAFVDAGISAETSANIQGVIWEKLVFIAPLAGFGSLTRLPVGAYRSVPEARRMLAAMMQETVAVGAAQGVRIGTDAIERAMQYIDAARPQIMTSMQLDVQAGRTSELEALIGVVVRKGAELGIATPVASSMYGLLLPLEQQAR